MKNDKSKLIQLIHIAKSQLNIDDFSYREILKRLTNKTSSTKCTVVELHKVLHELQGKGAKVKWFAKRGEKPTAYSPATGEVKVKSEIAHKIRAVWIQMGKHGFLRDASEKALNAYMRKVMNQGKTVLTLNVGALKGDEASRFLEILKKWHKRVMVKALTEKGYELHSKANYDATVEFYNEVM
ncbi:E16 protein [Actinobacillus minor NM305]|uniref:E16 protein n=1 Tax=Actinobacillus minor NM305 TaxID=637911 RepID=C5S4Q0_9PAST|nr:phage protein GemA/Gp16 family protein [Actinobacillus minor]EER46139.1 E16 protein [Actinobacillus minor NM305]